MIQANELRIGNLVKFYYEVGLWLHTKVTHDCFSGNYKKFEHIPLTEDILLKCGFIVNNDNVSDIHTWCDYVNDNIVICLPYFTYTSSDGDLEIEIKSLHQLQNLYFALNQKELEVSL